MRADAEARLRERVATGLSVAADRKLQASPAGRYSHSDATLYISVVILHTRYTGRRQNDFNVYAYSRRCCGRPSTHGIARARRARRSPRLG